MPDNVPDFVRGLQRVVQPTDSRSFRDDFEVDAAGALAAKGLVLSADEQSRVNTEVAGIFANQRAIGETEATEVEVSVKVKF